MARTCSPTNHRLSGSGPSAGAAPFLALLSLALPAIALAADPLLLAPAPTSYNDFAPDWSPDAKRLLFTSDRDPEAMHLFEVDVSTGEIHQLTSGPDNFTSGSYFPDGSRIAFVSGRTGSNELYDMGRDGSDIRQLTTGAHGGLGERPGWSPDGGMICFEWAKDADDADVWIIDVETLETTRLTTDSAQDKSPMWSPDGSRIVFMSRRSPGSNIYTIDVDGTDLTQVTNDRLLHWAPDWSPDGSRIVYWAGSLPAWNIYTINPDGTEKRQLTQRWDWNWSPAYAPDGSQIAFDSRHDGRRGIYIMDADGSNIRKLTNLEHSQFVHVALEDGVSIALERLAYSTYAGQPDATYVQNTEAHFLVRELIDRERADEALMLAQWNLARFPNESYARDWYIYARRANGLDAPACTGDLVNAFRENDDERAFEAFAESKRRFPAWKPLSDGWIRVPARERLGEGRFAECERICRLAVEEHPDSASAHALLAHALLEQGKSGEARSMAQHAVELQPDHGRARRVLERLGTD